jgi:HSP20 family protein
MEDKIMAEAAKNLPESRDRDDRLTPTSPEWHPFTRLREQVDRMFDDFRRSTWQTPFDRTSFEPFWRAGGELGAAPAVDIAEKDDAYEVTAELPGMDERDIDVQVAEGMLVIKGEKKEEKEEKKKDFFISERRFGSFRRSFRVPESVDADKIEAQFKKGILTVTLPKLPEAKSKERKIAVSAR